MLFSALKRQGVADAALWLQALALGGAGHHADDRAGDHADEGADEADAPASGSPAPGQRRAPSSP